MSLFTKASGILVFSFSFLEVCVCVGGSCIMNQSHKGVWLYFGINVWLHRGAKVTLNTKGMLNFGF